MSADQLKLLTTTEHNTIVIGLSDYRLPKLWNFAYNILESIVNNNKNVKYVNVELDGLDKKKDQKDQGVRFINQVNKSNISNKVRFKDSKDKVFKKLIITTARNVSKYAKKKNILIIGTSVASEKSDTIKYSDKGSLKKHLMHILGKDTYNNKKIIIINKDKYLDSRLSFYSLRDELFKDNSKSMDSLISNYQYIIGINYIVNFPNVVTK